MSALEKQLISLQQKLEHLNTEVATLLALTSANQQTSAVSTVSPTGRPIIERTPANTQKAQVGINRYRQIATEQAGHSAAI